MKVALINTHDTYGGAARSVFRLHRGLRNAGIESTILCLDKRSDDPNAQILSVDNSVESQKLRNDWNRQQQDVNSRLVKSHCAFFSLPVPGYDISSHPVVLNADIVHLNWVTGILSPDSVGALLDSGKRLVWTLHDQRSFTGGCHFSDGCDEYKSECAICHFLPSEFATLAQASLLHAEKFYDSSNICIVSPSRWLADCARQSRLFSNCRIELIPYGIDTGVYLPIDKYYARFKNGLSAKAFTILFGSVDLAEKRKGGHVLAAALQHCLKEPAIAAAISTANLEFVTFGRNCSGELWPSCVKHAGYIGTEEQMAELYSASDIFVCPTLDDNLPNTIIEAMSCGVPVIASRVGGVPDLIEDGKDGWLFNPNDSAMLAEKILTLFKEQKQASEAGLEARIKIQKSFTLSLQANNYINIYKDILSKNPFEKKSLSAGRPSSLFKEVANYAPFQSGGSVAKKAGLICVTRNSAVKLKATLESIVRHTNPSLFDLYVVDNGSTDSTAELCAGPWPPNIHFIRKNENLGWVGGINSCLPEAKKHSFVGFLNDDIEVGPRWLDHLIQVLEGHKTVGAVGPLTSNDRDWQGYDRFRLGPTRPGLPELEGIDREDVVKMAAAMESFNPGVTFNDAVLAFFCVLIRSEIVERIGLLDEAFNDLDLGSDDDYCKRILASGNKLALSFNAYVANHQSLKPQGDKGHLLALSLKDFTAQYSGVSSFDFQAYEERFRKVSKIISCKAAAGVYSGKEGTNLSLSASDIMSSTPVEAEDILLNAEIVPQNLGHMVCEGHLGGFFSEGDGGSYYPLMWPHLVRKLGIRSVLDVGCGRGYSSLFFKSLGCEIKGIDGSPEAQATNLLGDDFVLADYAIGPSPIQSEFDLVWSCEFVEHVEEKFMKNYLQDFRRGRFLAMTFAGPGQAGHHHVNCRPEEYWIRIMYSQGFDHLPEETAELREYARKDMEKNDSESDKRFVYHFMYRGLLFKKSRNCSGGL